MTKTGTLYKKIESVLYQGATFTNLNSQQGNGESTSYSTNFSPNNLKTIIMSQEGMVLGFHTTVGNNKVLTRRINFPQTAETYQELTEGKELLSFLVDKRVFTAVEEIVIIVSTGQEPAFTLPKRQIDYIKVKLIPRLKRVADVIVSSPVLTTLEDFQEYYKPVMKDPLHHIADDKDLSSASGVWIIKGYPDWFDYTNLRPSYYRLDGSGGTLAKRFSEVKQHFDVDAQPVSTPNISSPKNEMTPEFQLQLRDLDKLFTLIKKTYISNINNDSTLPLSGHSSFNDYLNQLFIFKPLRIHYVLDEVTLEKYPDLAKYNTFILRVNQLTGFESVTKIGLTEISAIRKSILAYYVKRIRTLYFGVKSKKANPNKTLRVADTALYLGFNRLIRGSYSDFKHTLKNRKDPLTDEFVNEMELMSTFPFKPVSNNFSSITPKATPNLDSTYGWEDLINSQPLRSHSIFNLVADTYLLEKGYVFSEPNLQSMSILKDALVLILKTGDSLSSSTLARVFNGTAETSGHAVDIDASTITDTLSILATKLKEIHPDWLPDKNSLDFEDNLEESEFSTTDLEDKEEELDTDSLVSEDFGVGGTSDFDSDLEDSILEDEERKRIHSDEDSDTKEEDSSEDNLDSDEQDYHPKKSVIKVIHWSHKLKNLYNEPRLNSTVLSAKPTTNTLISNLDSWLHDSKIEIITKKEQDTFIELFTESLNKINDVPLRIYLNMKSTYFSSLKSVTVLNSGTVSFENGFENYFALGGTRPAPEDTHLYLRALYYILKGRVR